MQTGERSHAPIAGKQGAGVQQVRERGQGQASTCSVAITRM